MSRFWYIQAHIMLRDDCAEDFTSTWVDIDEDDNRTVKLTLLSR